MQKSVLIFSPLSHKTAADLAVTFGTEYAISICFSEEHVTSCNVYNFDVIVVVGEPDHVKMVIKHRRRPQQTLYVLWSASEELGIAPGGMAPFLQECVFLNDVQVLPVIHAERMRVFESFDHYALSIIRAPLGQLRVDPSAPITPGAVSNAISMFVSKDAVDQKNRDALLLLLQLPEDYFGRLERCVYDMVSEALGDQAA